MRAWTATFGVFQTNRPGWHHTACPASSCTTRSCPALTSLCAIMRPPHRDSGSRTAWPLESPRTSNPVRRYRPGPPRATVATLEAGAPMPPSNDPLPNASAGSAIPLPVHGPESRTADGRLASWVFDLPVVELRAGNRARRSRLAGGPDYLKAVRAQVESEVAFDRLWRAAIGDVRVRALRDGDR